MKKTASLFIATLIGLASASSANAASSAWFKTEGANVRLIALPSADGKTIQAGLQIDLKKGWKTYWRAPGATGLPPQVSFAGSQNLASATMDFPVPMTFGQDANLTAGYDKSVTLPILVEPLFANRNTTIKSQGLIGLCEEICIPVQFQLELTLDGKGASSRDVASALLQAKSNMMGSPRDDFKVSAVEVVNSKGRGLSVSANVPEGTSQATLMVEGPSNWYLNPVHATSIDGGKAQFELPLSDIPADANIDTTELTFSLLANGEGVSEVRMPK